MLLVTWLTDVAQIHNGSMVDLLQAICDGLVDRGLPIERVHVSFVPNHPQLRVGVLQWSPGQTASWGHAAWPEDRMRSPSHRRNPVRLLRKAKFRKFECSSTLARFLNGIGSRESWLRKGFTDYFGLALNGGYQRPVTLAFMTRYPGGFSEENLVDFRTVAWASQAAFQRETLRTLTGTITSTYLGKSTGARVVAGEMRRGATSRMKAVVWFSDLRGFTQLSERLNEEHVIEMLNVFFDSVGECIEANGGEILKFIGDAVLAVFPYEDETSLKTSCAAAVQGALLCLEKLDEVNRDRLQRGEPTVRTGIGLHRGEVVYGNIGTPTRLDFTVLGHPVNMASRLSRAVLKLVNFLGE